MLNHSSAQTNAGQAQYRGAAGWRPEKNPQKQRRSFCSVQQNHEHGWPPRFSVCGVTSRPEKSAAALQKRKIELPLLEQKEKKNPYLLARWGFSHIGQS
ncbi:MAG: hypothetical protein ACK5L3_10830 [Oscillospiraceae bacterium]